MKEIAGNKIQVSSFSLPLLVFNLSLRIPSKKVINSTINCAGWSLRAFPIVDSVLYGHSRFCQLSSGFFLSPRTITVLLMKQKIRSKDGSGLKYPYSNVGFIDKTVCANISFILSSPGQCVEAMFTLGGSAGLTAALFMKAVCLSLQFNLSLNKGGKGL